MFGSGWNAGLRKGLRKERVYLVGPRRGLGREMNFAAAGVHFHYPIKCVSGPLEPHFGLAMGWKWFVSELELRREPSMCDPMKGRFCLLGF